MTTISWQPPSEGCCKVYDDCHFYGDHDDDDDVDDDDDDGDDDDDVVVVELNLTLMMLTVSSLELTLAE